MRLATSSCDQPRDTRSRRSARPACASGSGRSTFGVTWLFSTRLMIHALTACTKQPGRVQLNRKANGYATLTRMDRNHPLPLIGATLVIVPSSRWQRVVITALLVLPLVLVVALSAPAWLVLPFLSAPRRDAVLKLFGSLIDGITVISGASEAAPAANLAPRYTRVLPPTVEPTPTDAEDQALRSASIHTPRDVRPRRGSVPWCPGRLATSRALAAFRGRRLPRSRAAV